MIKCYITDKGDPSVGIWELHWELECPFDKDADYDCREFFRDKIKELYKEFSEGKILVEFEDELKYRDL